MTYTVGSAPIILDLDVFASESQYSDCWEYDFFFVGSATPPVDDPNVIVLDSNMKRGAVYTTNESSANEYHARFEANDIATGEEKIAY